MPDIIYKRIVLKLSGEALAHKPSDKSYGNMAEHLACEVRSAHEKGAQIGIVIGGGNIFRGIEKESSGVKDRVTADNIGMLATIINSLVLKDAIEQKGIEAEVLTAVEIASIGKRFTKSHALKALKSGRILIFAGGTGNPFFSTDTAAALRALEIEADAIIKGSKVDGVYDKDPMVHSDAVKMSELCYDDALTMNLGVMDQTAFALLKDYHIPIVVCKMVEPGFLDKVLMGDDIGSVVK